MSPGSLDPREASLLKLLLKEARTNYCSEPGVFIGWTLGRYSQNDRIVPVIDGLDIHDRFISDITSIIPCPFSKWPLPFPPLGIDKSFEHDLCMGRDGESCDLPPDDRIRFAS
jgi:hypothetical protein